MKKIWREIASYEGIYQVSNYGEVRGKNGLLKTYPTPKTGKLRVDLYVYERGGRKWHAVHLLVLDTFVGDAPPGPHKAIHLNGDIKDNKLTNLAWRRNPLDRPSLTIPADKRDWLNYEISMGILSSERMAELTKLPLEVVLRFQYGRHWRTFIGSK